MADQVNNQAGSTPPNGSGSGQTSGTQGAGSTTPNNAVAGGTGTEGTARMPQANTGYQSTGSSYQTGYQTPGSNASGGTYQNGGAYQSAGYQPYQPTYGTTGGYQAGNTQSFGTYGADATTSWSQQQSAYTATPTSANGGKKHAKKDAEGKRTFWRAFAGAALAVVIGFVCFGVYQAVASGSSTSSSNLQTAANTGTSTTITVDGEDTTLSEAVASKVTPSVGIVTTYLTYSHYLEESGYGSFSYGGSSGSDELVEYGQGSCVVYTADGYLITNYHVIENADAVTVTLNGTDYDATLVGSDPTSDIAVLKIDASGLTPIEVGSSSDLQVGDWVMTVGSPFGVGISVSDGIVSALQRSTTYELDDGTTLLYPNLIQTDASVNPGNSGGALVNSNGELVGICTLASSYSGDSAGVNFAIPSDYAIGLVDQIIAGETPSHAYLGVSMASSDSYGYSSNTSVEGVLVAQVYDGTAAADAGIQQGDIITAFDGETVTSPSDLQLDVRKKNPGDTVEITLVRNGQEMTVSVTLGSDENATSSSGSNNGGNDYGYGGYGNYGYDYGYSYGSGSSYSSDSSSYSYAS